MLSRATPFTSGLTLLILGAIGSPPALACGGSPAVPAGGVEKIGLEAAIDLIWDRHHVNVELTGGSKCGGPAFRVSQPAVGGSRDQQLGMVELPSPGKESTGGLLVQAVEQLLQTPRAELLALQGARDLLWKDSDALKKEYGISVYDPNALSDAQRFPAPGRQLLMVTTEKCDESTMTSSSKLGKGSVLVPLTTYVAGTVSYPDGSIYREGDLQRAILRDRELLLAARERFDMNDRFCTGGFFKRDWRRLSAQVTVALELP
jgi:hypothetical protein